MRYDIAASLSIFLEDKRAHPNKSGEYALSISKPALAASAAGSVLSAVGAANATIVGTFSASLSSQIHTDTTIAETGSGTGSGTLDTTTGFTLNATEIELVNSGLVVPSETITVSESDNFTGTISGTTFTATGGAATVVSCTGAVDCETLGTFTFLSVAGTVSLVGGGAGTLLGVSKPGGLKQADTWTIPSAVPLSPTLWLLGSGLLGLVGNARLRPKRGTQ